MMKRFWSTMLVAAVCASPAVAQTPAATPSRDAKPPVVAPTGDPGSIDLADDDMLAAVFDDGPLAAPMEDEGPGGMRHGPGGMGMHGRRGPDEMHAHMAMLADELELTDAQRDKIHGIFETQMRRGIQERADIQIATLDLRKLMHADTPNRGAIDSQVDKLARMRATLAKERIGAMLDAHAVLTPEQRQKLEKLRGQGWGGRHGGHGHGGGDGGPGMGGDDEQ
ncbi:MAG: Spy/CpxP family protein refolding chaperone [Candidatus Eisenbacteria bacterium]